jgi:hypothetical protein
MELFRRVLQVFGLALPYKQVSWMRIVLVLVFFVAEATPKIAICTSLRGGMSSSYSKYACGMPCSSEAHLIDF